MFEKRRNYENNKESNKSQVVAKNTINKSISKLINGKN